jgi:hypothetical protein
MHPYPASVGGDDTGGYVLPGNPDSLDEVRIWYTTDNGDSWSDTLAFAETKLVEPTIGRVGRQDKWVMVVRDNSTGDIPGQVSTSTDLLNWTTPVQMNKRMGGNRPKIVSHDNYLHLMTTNRGNLTGYPKTILMQRVDSETAYNNPGSVWKDWESLSNDRDTVIGYPDIKKVNGRHVATYCSGENADANASNLSIMSTMGLAPVDYHEVVNTTAFAENTGDEFFGDSPVQPQLTIEESSDFVRQDGTAVEIARDGTYRLTGSLNVEPFAASGFAEIRILVSNNAVKPVGSVWVDSAAGFNPTAHTSRTLDLTEGKRIKLLAYQNSGSTETIDRATLEVTYLDI